MKTSIQYSLKTIFAFGLVASLPLFTSCEKDNEKPSQPEPKIVKLVFDKNGHHIELDTIRYYLNQGADSIYMIPNNPNMFATDPEQAIHNATLFLQDRVNLSTRVRGRETLNVSNAVNVSDVNQLRQIGFTVNIANAKQH